MAEGELHQKRNTKIEETNLHVSIEPIPSDSMSPVKVQISNDTPAIKEYPDRRPRRSPSKDTVAEKDDVAQRSKRWMPEGSPDKRYESNHPEECVVSNPPEGCGQTLLSATKSQTNVSPNAACGSLQDQHCGQTKTGTSYPDPQCTIKEETPQHVSRKAQSLEHLGGEEAVSDAVLQKGTQKAADSLDEKLEPSQSYENFASKADAHLVVCHASQHDKRAPRLNESRYSPPKETKTDKSFTSLSDENRASSSDTSSTPLLGESQPLSGESPPSLVGESPPFSGESPPFSGESSASLSNDYQASLAEESQVPVSGESQAFLSDESQASQRASASASSALPRFEGSAGCAETNLPGANHDPHTGMDSASPTWLRRFDVVLDESENSIGVFRMSLGHNAHQQMMVARPNGVDGSESQHHGGARNGRRTFTSAQLGDNTRLRVMVRDDAIDGESQGQEHPGARDLSEQREDLGDDRDLEEVFIPVVGWPWEINAVGDLHIFDEALEMENAPEDGSPLWPVPWQNHNANASLHHWITQVQFPFLTARDGRDRTVCFVETCPRDQHCVFLFNCHHTVCIECFGGTIPHCPFCGQRVFCYFRLNQEEEEEILDGRRGIT